MRDRVARLRFWLAGSAFLLLAVIAGFIGYGRFVSRLRHLKLPLAPGVNIVREAGGWTYSRANGSKTLYTIHAAGFQQGKNGKTALHDVSVVLFGKNGDRNDRVSGQDFEYDEKNGVLRALGLVHIDLQSAAAAKAVGQGGQASVVEGPAGEESLAPGVMHVTTSGLVYLDKLGVAATSEDVDVQSGNMKGHARGADYSSDSGMLMLHSAVEISGNSGGNDVRITAGQAQFDQRAREARLTNATYATQGRSVAADRAVLYRRVDGTLGKVDADGNVRLSAPGGKAVARQAELQMNAAGQPASAILQGDVVYTANEPVRQVRAEASEARVSFGGGAKVDPEHAVFSGAVRMLERVRAEEASERWSSRELTATKVETWLAAGPGGKTQLRNAIAKGNARLVATEDAAGLKPTSAIRTELAADELKAVMSRSGERVSLEEVRGTGNTSMRQVTVGGVEQTSAGDTLEARFRPASGAAKAKPGVTVLSSGAVALASAVQQGHVTMSRRLPQRDKGKPEDVQLASADKATYDGGTDQAVLVGSVRMHDATGALWAQQVTIDRTTGNAHAVGQVKADFVQEAGNASSTAEPMHILAERADVDKANASAIFYGRPVRVWQGGNQVQAPEVQVERAAKRMIARSGKSGSSAGINSAVRTILVSRPAAATDGQQGNGGRAACGTDGGATAQSGKGRDSAGNVVKIVSGGLMYSGSLNQVQFTGGVRAETVDGIVRAVGATAYLMNVRGNKSETASLEAGVERIIAEGEVGLTRPGTHVSGERLVYQAANRSFVLSGGRQQPAKAVDARGTSTAAAFRFSACDDTLEALGEAPGAATRKVETEASATGAGKKEKAGR